MAVVFITGSNSGFGLEGSLGFLRLGHTVIATMRDPERSTDLLSAVAAEGLEAPQVVQLDVTDDRSRRRAVDRAVTEHGSIDILVNNAGVSYFGSLEDAPESDYRYVYETNLFGPVELIRLVLPSMRAAGRGRIVNVTAIAAILCNAFRGPYVGVKHAFDATTAALDLEIMPFGLRAVSVLPAAFQTRIRSNARAAEPSPAYEEVAKAMLEGLTQRINNSTTPMSEYVDVLLRAALDESPEPRYLVGGSIIEGLRPIVDQLSRLHRSEQEKVA